MVVSSNDINRCTCLKDVKLSDNDVEKKVKQDLRQVAYGPNFGDILYKCNSCGQFWEENLSQAKYHDWPPILIKISAEEAKLKYDIK